MNELKPCPFPACGSENISIRFSWLVWSYCVYCEDCKCEGPIARTARKAAKLWNTRHSQE